MSIHTNPFPNRIPESEELWQIVTTEHGGEWYATESGVDATGSSEDKLPPGLEHVTGEQAAVVSYVLKLHPRESD